MKKINIDLSEYKLCKPDSINKSVGGVFIDIEVEDDNTFFIVGKNDMILTHNCDGDAICAMLINFFYRNWKELFDEKRMYKVLTPLLVANKGKEKLFFYTEQEYQQWAIKANLNNWNIQYKKGLASLLDDEYEMMIRTPRLMLIQADDLAKQSLNVWFGKDSQLRKDKLNGNG